MHGFHWIKENKVPVLQPNRLVYVGLRDIDPPEKKIIRSMGIKAYTMHEVDKYGIGKVRMTELLLVLQCLPLKHQYLWCGLWDGVLLLFSCCFTGDGNGPGPHLGSG